MLQRNGISYGGAVIGNTAEVCGPAGPSQVRCDALIRLDTPRMSHNASPDRIPGYHPADLVSAYKLPSSDHGSGQTIAIVVPLDDPFAGGNLDHYRATFGLPPCTKSNGCFTKVDQRGSVTHHPAPDPNWAVVTSVDLDMASAICPNCHLLLVETDADSIASVAAGVETAARLGANVINNGYLSTDYSQNSHYNHPGKIVVAIAGNLGHQNPAYFPAGSQYVVAVGGTSLHRSGNARGWTEKVWYATGSGCSPLPKPSWQHGPCPTRTVVDVAAVGDPNTGIAAYDTYNQPGWMVLGGTAVSAPIIAGVYALAANEGQLHYARGLYRFRNRLFDVTQGSNGSCGGKAICTAKVGYDGPSGNGTPNGLGAF